VAVAERLSQLQQGNARLRAERDELAREAAQIRYDRERLAEEQARSRARLAFLEREHAGLPERLRAAGEGSAAREAQLARNAEASLVIVGAVQRQLADTRGHASAALGDARAEILALRRQVAELAQACGSLREQSEAAQARALRAEARERDTETAAELAVALLDARDREVAALAAQLRLVPKGQTIQSLIEAREEREAQVLDLRAQVSEMRSALEGGGGEWMGAPCARKRRAACAPTASARPRSRPILIVRAAL